MKLLENPMVKHREHKPVLIGMCEQCGNTIYSNNYHGKYEDHVFCDAVCFHRWIGYREAG